MKNSIFLFILLLLIACKKNAEEKIPDNVFYTCSMDPQVMEKKPGKCPVCKMELTKVVIDENASAGLKLSKEQETLANIKTMIVAETEMGNEKTVNGRLVINENKVTRISSRVAGRIEKLHVRNTGEMIHAGTLLYEIYSEELLAAQKEYLMALEKSKLLSGSELDYNQLTESARNKLVLWGMNDSQLKALAEKKDVRHTTPVYSRQSGTVTSLAVKEGDYVMDGDVVLEVTDLSSLWVVAELFASEVSEFNNNDPVKIRVNGFPDKEWESRISFAAPQLEVQSKVNLMRAEIHNAGLLLKPGMQADVVLKGSRRKTMAVPVNAVLQDSRGAILWIKKKDGTYESRMVVTGTESNGLIEIRTGIEIGEEVVISGAYLLNSEYIFKKGSSPMEGHDM